MACIKAFRTVEGLFTNLQVLSRLTLFLASLWTDHGIFTAEVRRVHVPQCIIAYAEHTCGKLQTF